MSRPRVLLTLVPPAHLLSRLSASCELTTPKSAWPIPRDELLSLIPGHDALFCSSADKIDEHLLAAAGPQLKVIGTMSAGYDHVDTCLLRGHGIVLGNTPGVLADSVAEINIWLVLAVLRSLKSACASIRDGAWTAGGGGSGGSGGSGLFGGLGTSLVGTTVGILGMGCIGLATARRLAGFVVGRIVFVSRTSKPQVTDQVGAVQVSMDDLAKESDVVVVTLSLNDVTRKIVNREFLAKMKKTAILVNSSRGDVIDQEALVEALQSNGIGGAGLDVMTPEPLPSSHPLLAMDNVVLTPHIGSATVAAREGMASLTIDNILAGLQGKTMPAPVNL